MSDVQAAIEARDARVWEEESLTVDEEVLRREAKNLDFVIGDLDTVSIGLMEVESVLKDYKLGDDVRHVIGEIESACSKLKVMRDNWKKGVA